MGVLIESWYKIKLGKNVENHLGKLVALYKEETKENKSWVPKELSKYLDAFMWLKAETKFGSHFLSGVNLFQMIFLLVMIGPPWGSKVTMGPQIKITGGLASDMTKQKRWK